MTIALVSSTKRANAGTTADINTTNATLLVACVSALATIPTPTDSNSNTWTKLTTRTGAFTSETAIFYVVNPTVGAGHNFTIGGTVPAICVAAFSGVTTTSPLDKENGANESASPTSTGSVTPSENNEVLIAIAGGQYTSGSIDGGFTKQEDLNLAGGVNFGAALAYLIQTTAASANPAWTTTNGCSVAIATFKVAAAGGFFGSPLMAIQAGRGNV